MAKKIKEEDRSGIPTDKEERVMIGLKEQLEMDGYEFQKGATTKKIVYIKLDHVLDPPIYKDALTTRNSTKDRVGQVKAIEPHPVGFKIYPQEGEPIVVPLSSVKHFIEE